MSRRYSTICVTVVAHSAQGRYAQQLLNDLMENYSNALRPVEDTDKALNVTLQITLSQIKDMVGHQGPPPFSLLLSPLSLSVSLSLFLSFSLSLSLSLSLCLSLSLYHSHCLSRDLQ